MVYDIQCHNILKSKNFTIVFNDCGILNHGRCGSNSATSPLPRGATGGVDDDHEIIEVNCGRSKLG